MLRLFIRFYLFLLLLPILILMLIGPFFLDIPFLRDYSFNGIAAGQLAPTFSYIEGRLLTTHEANWPSMLTKLEPDHGAYSPVSIDVLDDLHLPATQMQRLKDGQIIADAQFFSAPIADTANPYAVVAYQRIDDSNQVLAFVLKSAQTDHPQAIVAWLLHFVGLTLQENQQASPKQVLAGFSKKYGISVQVEPLSALPVHMQNYLRANQFIYDEDPSFSVVTKVYQLYQGNQVLVIGPYDYPWYLEHFWLLFGFFLLLVIGLIILLSLYYFYSDLTKLDQLAQAYGEGDFHYSAKLGRFAALSRLYRNLQKMGKQIQSLLSSHQELTQAISHELKTPLARVKFALAMVEESKTKSLRQEYLQEAESALSDLDGLVRELLLYARFERAHFKAKDQSLILGDFLKPFLQNLPMKYSKKMVSINVADELQHAAVHIQGQYLQRILENLLSNAERYAKSKVVVELFVEDSQVVMNIADDGSGIPPADRERIFEPFVSLDSSRNKELSGHGLGLAIVKRIVTAHSGSIEVSTSPSLQGALFSVKFPIFPKGRL